MEKINQKISNLVGNDPRLNAILFKLGIHFYNYSEETLAQVCKAKGLSPELVVGRLNEAVESNKKENVDLSIFPVELVVEYLKHSHYLFIKDRISYLLDLINNPELPETDLIRDLRTVFPEFVKDFIQHVHEEEDSLFAYIYLLNKGLRKGADLKNIWNFIQDYPVKKYAEEHRKESDDMKGLRQLTTNYNNKETGNIHLTVLMESLRDFNDELENHARIENEILFPKAEELESQVVQLINSKNADHLGFVAK